MRMKTEKNPKRNFEEFVKKPNIYSNKERKFHPNSKLMINTKNAEYFEEYDASIINIYFKFYNLIYF